MIEYLYNITTSTKISSHARCEILMDRIIMGPIITKSDDSAIAYMWQSTAVWILLLWSHYNPVNTEEITEVKCGSGMISLTCQSPSILNVIDVTYGMREEHMDCNNISPLDTDCTHTASTRTDTCRGLCNTFRTCFCTISYPSTSCYFGDDDSNNGSESNASWDYTVLTYECINVSGGQTITPMDATSIAYMGNQFDLRSQVYPVLTNEMYKRLCKITLDNETTLRVNILHLEPSVSTYCIYMVYLSGQKVFCATPGSRFDIAHFEPSITEIYMWFWPATDLTTYGRFWILLTASDSEGNLSGEQMMTINCAPEWTNALLPNSTITTMQPPPHSTESTLQGTSNQDDEEISNTSPFTATVTITADVPVYESSDIPTSTEILLPERNIVWTDSSTASTAVITGSIIAGCFLLISFIIFVFIFCSRNRFFPQKKRYNNMSIFTESNGLDVNSKAGISFTNMASKHHKLNTVNYSNIVVHKENRPRSPHKDKMLEKKSNKAVRFAVVSNIPQKGNVSKSISVSSTEKQPLSNESNKIDPIIALSIDDKQKAIGYNADNLHSKVNKYPTVQREIREKDQKQSPESYLEKRSQLHAVHGSEGNRQYHYDDSQSTPVNQENMHSENTTILVRPELLQQYPVQMAPTPLPSNTGPYALVTMSINPTSPPSDKPLPVGSQPGNTAVSGSGISSNSLSSLTNSQIIAQIDNLYINAIADHDETQSTENDLCNF